jgi:choline kinase
VAETEVTPWPAFPREVLFGDLRDALAALCGPVPLPATDPEVRHLATLEQRLLADPAGYVRRIKRLGDARLHEDSSRAALPRLLSRLTELRQEAGLGAYACAEAMEICLADLVILEELERTDVPVEAVHLLRDNLVTASVDLVGRLLRNLAMRAQVARHKQPNTDDPEVRKLSELLLEEPWPAAITHDPDQPVLVIATAGRGTRLRSTVPKGLVPLAGEPMICRTVRTAAEAGIRQVVFVLKYRADVQAEYLARQGTVLVQKRAEGTGHSVITALAALPEQRAPVLVCYSDVPFLTPQRFAGLLEQLDAGADFVAATFPTGNRDDMGLVARDGIGRVVAIGQPRFGLAHDSAYNEADGGVYAFSREVVFDALGRTLNDNVRHEYSFTAAVATLAAMGARVRTVLGPVEDYMSVNVPGDLILARLRAATGATPGSDWHNEEQRRAALAFFSDYNASHTDESALAAHVERASSLVGALLDLNTEQYQL